MYLWFCQDRLHLNNAQIDLELLSTCTIFVVVDGSMVHILVVFGALWLAIRPLQWDKPFRLEDYT